MLERTGHGKAVDWYLLGILVYEMLVGVPPFTVKTPEEMHQKLAAGKMMMPSHVSLQAKDLILKVIQLLTKLLRKDPAARLGSGPGEAEDIKKHPFFEGIDWRKVLGKKLPVPKPTLKPLVPYLFSDEVFQEGSGRSKTDEMVENWSFVID